MKNVAHAPFMPIMRLVVLVMLAAGCAPPLAGVQGESPAKATAEPTVVSSHPTPTGSKKPEITDTPQECGETQGRFIEESYSIPGDRRGADVIIYLPPCYEPRGGPYAVAFFLHGYPQDERHWIDLGAISTYEDFLARDQIEPTVLVFPYQPEPYFTQTDGGPDSFEELFLEALLADIDEEYAISARPSDRALLGVSRGGVWALEIGMRHPDRFDIVVALSPALAYNHPRRAYDPFEIAHSAGRLPEHILISVGDREPQFAGEIDRFVSTLEQAEIKFEYLQHEGRHEDEAWQGIMEQVFLFLGERLQD